MEGVWTLNTNAMMDKDMTFGFGQSEEMRREELVRTIEHSVEQLTLGELEALYYDMVSKDYVKSLTP